MLDQAADFGAESAALDGFLQELDPEMWTRPTAFKGWTPNEILLHLHHWNRAQDRALTDPEGFRQDVTQMFAAIEGGSARAEEARATDLRGDALRALWASYSADIAARWSDIDPKHRLPWVGPEMSARSAMTARQMETWAHGLAIWDLVGKARPEADRLRN
ncbi:MAG: maleylpyruvate isomerase N-terminal domain-containing protein, partial [Pseudomonadota bacterium]